MTNLYFRSTSSGSNNACREVPLEMEPLYLESNTDNRNFSLESYIKAKSKLIKNATKRKEKFKCLFSHLGLLMAVGSSLLFSLCSLIVKVLNIPSSELAVFRFTGVLLPTLPLVIARRESLFPKGQRFLLLLRGIFGTTSLLLQFYSFQHLPLGDASVIVFSAPVFVTLFARIFLKEACGVFQTVLILLTLFGVVLITRPPWLLGSFSGNYTSSEWKGAIAAFTGTIVAANVYVLLRVLKNIHYSIILFDFSLVALIITPLAAMTSSHPCVPSCGYQRWLIVAIGFLSFGGQILKTKALQIEEAGPVAIARTADVVFAFIWQLIFFGELPDLFTLLGTMLVTSSVLLLGIRRWILSKPKNSSVRKYLACITW
ncbi:UNVERIFIED_CONTAM: hypothetical protein RMT77_000098 [Armadillidium vulgare]